MVDSPSETQINKPDIIGVGGEAVQTQDLMGQLRSIGRLSGSQAQAIEAALLQLKDPALDARSGALPGTDPNDQTVDTYPDATEPDPDSTEEDPESVHTDIGDSEEEPNNECWKRNRGAEKNSQDELDLQQV